jgi:hypothetical protein
VPDAAVGGAVERAGGSGAGTGGVIALLRGGVSAAALNGAAPGAVGAAHAASGLN